MRSPARLALAFALAAPLLASGCAAPGASSVAWFGVQRYQPLRVPSLVSRAEADRAARATLQSIPIAAVSDEDGAIRAVVPTDRTTRDVMVVRVAPNGELSVDVRTELSDNGMWKRADYMCDGYLFSRERALAARIVTAAALVTAMARR